MGRNYIAERTIADPVQRAAEKAKQSRARKARAAAERTATARYVEKMKWCQAKGCDKPVAIEPVSWFPCCSEDCFNAWNDSLPDQKGGVTRRTPP